MMLRCIRHGARVAMRDWRVGESRHWLLLQWQAVNTMDRHLIGRGLSEVEESGVLHARSG